MTERALPEANGCFICGPSNPIGLRLRFHEEGAGVAAEFVPGDLHIGWEGLIHGGLIAAVLDDAMANIWAWRPRAWTPRWRKSGPGGVPRP